MMNKTAKPPTTQRRFATIWGELDYLCKKVRYWLYERGQHLKAQRYADRLAHVLRRLPDNKQAIIREEGWALLGELKGDLGKAIAHRKREIRLMEKLHREAHTPGVDESTRSYMLRDRDAADLQERRLLLSSLVSENARRRADASAGNGMRRESRA
jgi:hypothetical protein